MNVRMCSKRREGASFGYIGQFSALINNFLHVIFWYRTQLLKNCSCNAVSTLRLFGITVARKYANFSLLKGKQGDQLWVFFFRLFAAPPVYAHESFRPSF